MTAEHRPRPRLSRRKKLVFALATCAFVCGVFEVYSRVREDSPAPSSRPGMLMPDAERGMALRPGFQGKSHSGFGLVIEVEVNAHGHRDREWGEKSEGGFRIACLGGSTTFGFGAMSNQSAYPKVLEERLREATPGRPVDVLNAGVHSWNTGTSRVNYALTLRPLKPDALVVLHGHNDLYEDANPAYALASDGKPVPGPSALLSLLRHSAGARRLERKVARARRRHFKRDHVNEAGAAAFARNLRALIAAARADGVRVLLCTFPHLFTDDEAETRAQFPPEAGRHEEFLRHSAHTYSTFVGGLRRYNDLIRRVGAEEGVAVLDLAASYPRAARYYVDYAHRNDEGHALLAGQVAERILREGWLNRP